MYNQKLEWLAYISAAGSMGLFLKVKRSEWRIMLAENGFWHEIATQGHSRWFILQSITGRQRVAYRHIILLALSLTFPKKYTLKSPKIAVIDNPYLINDW